MENFPPRSDPSSIKPRVSLSLSLSSIPPPPILVNPSLSSVPKDGGERVEERFASSHRGAICFVSALELTRKLHLTGDQRWWYSLRGDQRWWWRVLGFVMMVVQFGYGFCGGGSGSPNMGLVVVPVLGVVMVVVRR
ncbi:hypothetical protein Q3G72_006624 [Acer saccharum]|nr:hypothetical protein Q3G72_006624 [Acer saccharum]